MPLETIDYHQTASSYCTNCISILNVSRWAHSHLFMSLRTLLWSKVRRRMSCVEIIELKFGTENLLNSFNCSQHKTLFVWSVQWEARFAPSDMWKSVRSSQKSKPCQVFTVKIGIDYSGQLQTRHLNALPLFSSIKGCIWSFKGSQRFMVLKPCSLRFYQIHAPCIRVEVFIPVCLWTVAESNILTVLILSAVMNGCFR